MLGILYHRKDHLSRGIAQAQSHHVTQSQSFAQEMPRQRGDLDEHRVVDDARRFEQCLKLATGFEPVTARLQSGRSTI